MWLAGCYSCTDFSTSAPSSLIVGVSDPCPSDFRDHARAGSCSSSSCRTPCLCLCHGQRWIYQGGSPCTQLQDDRCLPQSSTTEVSTIQQHPSTSPIDNRSSFQRCLPFKETSRTTMRVNLPSIPRRSSSTSPSTVSSLTNVTRPSRVSSSSTPEAILSARS